jgi:hypothetical protein
MKSRLLVIPLILATTAAIADTQPSPSSRAADAQAQAATLLSPHMFSTSKQDGQRHSRSASSATMDAQASAAALLSGTQAVSTGGARIAVDQPSRARIAGDAQTQAAALLGGGSQSSSTDSQLQAQRTKDDVAHEGLRAL